jgi:hypothetical protein
MVPVAKLNPSGSGFACPSGEIFIFTWVSNVKQWIGDQYNRGVNDVVGIAGMVKGSGIIAGIVIVIIIGINLAGLLCICIFIHGHMVCRSSCKTDLAKGAYYKTKNKCCPMISNYGYHKNLEQKISNYCYNKNLEQKISD